MSTLLIAFNDVFRTCGAPEEYFDFGLWFPPDDLKQSPPTNIGQLGFAAAAGADGMGADQAGQAGQAEQAEQAAPPPPPPPPPQDDPDKKHFDAEYGQGKATADDIAAYAREKGFAPSYSDIKQLQETTGGKVTYNDYLKWANEISHKEDTPSHLVEFFKEYDETDQKTLPRNVIINLLCNFGEALTYEEAEGVLKATGITSDPVDYTELARKLLE